MLRVHHSDSVAENVARGSIAAGLHVDHGCRFPRFDLDLEAELAVVCFHHYFEVHQVLAAPLVSEHALLLDDIAKYGEIINLPSEIHRCLTVRQMHVCFGVTRLNPSEEEQQVREVGHGDIPNSVRNDEFFPALIEVLPKCPSGVPLRAGLVCAQVINDNRPRTLMGKLKGDVLHRHDPQHPEETPPAVQELYVLAHQLVRFVRHRGHHHELGEFRRALQFTISELIKYGSQEFHQAGDEPAATHLVDAPGEPSTPGLGIRVCGNLRLVPGQRDAQQFPQPRFPNTGRTTRAVEHALGVHPVQLAARREDGSSLVDVTKIILRRVLPIRINLVGIFQGWIPRAVEHGIAGALTTAVLHRVLDDGAEVEVMLVVGSGFETDEVKHPREVYVQERARAAFRRERVEVPQRPRRGPQARARGGLGGLGHHQGFHREHQTVVDQKTSGVVENLSQRRKLLPSPVLRPEIEPALRLLVDGLAHVLLVDQGELVGHEAAPVRHRAVVESEQVFREPYLRGCHLEEERHVRGWVSLPARVHL